MLLLLGRVRAGRRSRASVVAQARPSGLTRRGRTAGAAHRGGEPAGAAVEVDERLPHVGADRTGRQPEAEAAELDARRRHGGPVQLQPPAVGRLELQPAGQVVRPPRAGGVEQQALTGHPVRQVGAEPLPHPLVVGQREQRQAVDAAVPAGRVVGVVHVQHVRIGVVPCQADDPAGADLERGHLQQRRRVVHPGAARAGLERRALHLQPDDGAQHLAVDVVLRQLHRCSHSASVSDVGSRPSASADASAAASRSR